MFQTVFCQTKIESLFTRDDALLGELSAGMSLRDIENWFAVAPRKAVANAVLKGGSAEYSMTREGLKDTAPGVEVIA
jgi:hypothetical protein